MAFFFIFTLLFTLSFAANSPSLSPPAASPKSDLTPPPPSPLTPSPPADTPSPAENLKSEERKEGGIVVGVVVALCVVGLGRVLYKKRRQNIRHHINQPNPQPHLLVTEKSSTGNNIFYLVRGGNTPPQTLEATQFLRTLKKIRVLNPVNGCYCFSGEYVERDANNVETNRKCVVMWNPTDDGAQYDLIDVTPNEGDTSVVASGVYRDRPMLVKITVRANDDWVVGVYLLRTREWTTVYSGAPYKSCKLENAKICVDGVIYFRAFEGPDLQHRSNFFISLDLERMLDLFELEGMLDLERMPFGTVPLPWNLPSTSKFIQSVKVNGSLGLLEYNDDGVCFVWTMREGANDTLFWRICNFYGFYTFIMMHTIRVEGVDLYGDVLGFRNNGEAVVELYDDNEKKSRLIFYEPSSGRTYDVAIRGNQYSFVVMPLI